MDGYLNETAPLLPSTSPTSSPLSSPPPEQQQQQQGKPSRWHATVKFLRRADTRLVFAVMAQVVVANVGSLATTVPQLRMFEIIVCENYYRHNDTAPTGLLLPPPSFLVGNGSPIDERMCKIPPVQNKVAKLNGWNESLSAFVELLVAVYYGTLADQIGRKRILMLALLGSFLKILWVPVVCYFNNFFPIEAVWFSAVFPLIGGADQVYASIVYTMLADLIEQPQRTKVLYYVTAASGFSQFIGPPLGGWLMERNIWLPWQFLAVMGMLAGLIFFIMPETFPVAKQRRRNSNDSGKSTDSERDSETSGGDYDADPIPPQKTSSWGGALWARVRGSAGRVRTGFGPLMVPGLLCSFAIFLLEMIAKTSNTLHPQYASNKFSWNLHQTGWLMAIGPLESVAVNAVLLPALTTLNTRLGYLSTLRLDMWVIQVSLVLGFVGQLLVWSAHVPATMIGGIIIYSLATGLGPALQSISVSFVDKIHTARMFTMFAAVMTCGTMIGNPLMATLFSFGMKLGGEWLGLGYLAAAFLFSASLAFSFTLKLPPEAED